MTSFPVSATDPLGRQVTLTAARWFDHIVLKHPELSDTDRWVPVVLAVIRDPLVITRDKSRPDRRCFYRPVDDFGLHYRAYLRVVVEDSASEARVITAHLISRLPSKEILLWSRTV